MHLAQDNDVVHTFTPDRSDQPFGKAILPRRGWCGRSVPDAHGAQSAGDDAAIDPIAIRGLRPTQAFAPGTDVPLKPFLHDQDPFRTCAAPISDARTRS